MKRLKVSYALAAIALAACGKDDDLLVRVTLVGVEEGEALQIEDGRVDLGSDVLLYEAAVQVGRIKVETTASAVESTGAVNADLFTNTILVEKMASGEATAVELDFPQPELGSGVVQNERMSVVFAGLLGSTPFEFRATSIGRITASLPSRAVAVQLHVDLGVVFDALDEDTLLLEGGTYLIQSSRDGAAAHNSQAAAALEAALERAIVVGEVGEDTTSLATDDSLHR